MDFKMNPDFEAELAKTLQASTQEAVDVTARAHHEQGLKDVEGRLRQELEARGVTVTDDAWLEEMAGHVRESQVVIVTSADEIDSDAQEV